MADRDPLQSGEPREADLIALPAARRLKPGDRIEEYEIVRLVAAGQSALVYEARDRHLDRPAAVKVLLVGHPQRPNPDWTQEGRALSRVNHPNVVAVYRSGMLPDGNLFIAMEYAPGQTLREWLHERKRYSLGELLPILIEIASGLAAAHRAGVIHRDLKPENVVCDDDGSVKVLDLGIARLLDTARTTTAGLLVGTLAYLAPERIRGERYDGRCDVYAWGLMAYECLSGRHPMLPDGSWPLQHELAGRQLQLMPPPLPGLPAGFAALLARTMSKDPEERPSMRELHAELLVAQRRLTRGHGGAARSVQDAHAAGRLEGALAAVSGAVIGLLVAALVYSATHPRDPAPSPSAQVVPARAGPSSSPLPDLPPKVADTAAQPGASIRPAAASKTPVAGLASAARSATSPPGSASAPSTRPLVRSTKLASRAKVRDKQLHSNHRASRSTGNQAGLSKDATPAVPALGLGKRPLF